MKIFIIGGPGSGKSTMAQKLSEQYNIPHFDLDEINWINKNGHFYGQKRDKQERRSILSQQLGKHTEWIFEGVYCQDWINPILDQSDKIIILKPSKWIRFLRCTKRFVKRKLGIDYAPHKETFLSFYKLILWNHKYDEECLSLLLEKIKNKHVSYEIINK